MNDPSFEAYVVELKARHDEGKIDDAQYWAGLFGVVHGYAKQGRLEAAVQNLGLIPEAFITAIPDSGRPGLKAIAVELADILRSAGVVSPPVSSAAGRPS